MRDRYFPLLLLIIFTFSVNAQIKLKFVTVNYYGNNLYIDNVTVGSQFNNDAAVINLTNIKPDTSYQIGSAPVAIQPAAQVMNTGKNNISAGFDVTMTIIPGTYSSTKRVETLSSGQSAEVVFDTYTITPGQSFNITTTAVLIGDENSANNQFNQYSMVFPGIQRNILLEEWTSSTCAPCAANNPTVDAFVTSKFDSLVPVKYHMNWPSPGNDPMYLYNPDQANYRRFYYGVSGVPHVIMDGIVNPSYPYSNASSLPGAFGPRMKVGSPLSVNVVQTRIAGDSLKADVTVNVSAPLMDGDYKLRVHAIERKIRYATAPGTNGEVEFYDVFRKAIPANEGVAISRIPGTYNFSYTYKLDMAVWVDSMIYTMAFVQNDRTKEVINTGKSRRYAAAQRFSPGGIVSVEKPVQDENFISSNNVKAIISPSSPAEGVFHYTLFESAFPPAGWSLYNPDGKITFEKFIGANGPTFGGQNAVKMDFYSYSTNGVYDSLVSREFSGLIETDSVKFDYAYAAYSASYPDRLIVYLSRDGGATYPYTIFDKSGTSLATAGTSTSTFVPTSPSQWRTVSYSLTNIVPVELTSFNANAAGTTAEITWTTATEVNNLGFEVQRKSDGDFVTVGFVKGNGTSSEARSYSFTETDLPAGTYYYRLRQVDLDGTYDFSNAAEVDILGPMAYVLAQNYPNPFNPSTKIRFSIANDASVIVKVYNVLGAEVATLINGKYSLGTYSVDFNCSGLESGIYFYKLEAAEQNGSTFTDIKKMSFIK